MTNAEIDSYKLSDNIDITIGWFTAVRRSDNGNYNDK